MEAGCKRWILKNHSWERAVVWLLPTHHRGRCSFLPSQVTKPDLEPGTTGVWVSPEKTNSAELDGAAWGRAGFGSKSTTEFWKLKSIMIILPCGQHAPEKLFSRSPPWTAVGSSEQGKPERRLHAWRRAESEKQPQPELGWFPRVGKTTGMRYPGDSVHRGFNLKHLPSSRSSLQCQTDKNTRVPWLFLCFPAFTLEDPIPAVTNHHILSGWRACNFVILRFRRSHVWNGHPWGKTRCWPPCVPFGRSRGECIFLSFPAHRGHPLSRSPSPP